MTNDISSSSSSYLTTQHAIVTPQQQNQILKLNLTPFISQHDVDHTYELLFEATKKITGLYLMPVITVLGILGNILIVIVYQKSQKYSTNIYLIILSLSDLIKLANDFLYFVVNVTNKIGERRKKNNLFDLALITFRVFPLS